MNAIESLQLDTLRQQTRRHFLKQCTSGLGALWFASQTQRSDAAIIQRDPSRPLSLQPPHFKPKAKRVIYLHMAGSPSQLELFDYKPELERLDGQDCPASFMEGRRFAFIRGTPKLLGPVYPFHREKKTGLPISDRLPHFEKVLDKVCFLRTMTTDQFNHAPAQLLLHTGSPNLGSASAGAWATYGLGSENENLPGYMVLLSGGKVPSSGKSVWGSGFLPSVYQGVQCRSEGDPVLYLSNPAGVDQTLRGKVVDAVARMNRKTYESLGDPETITRIAQYEMAFRMQTSATDAFDIQQEPEHVHTLYGTEPGKESFANNCLLARRLVERGVRYVQLFDWGWDSHGAGESEALNAGFKTKCQQTDRPLMALLTDLEQRGVLYDTLVIWGGEFGRTPMQENRGGRKMKFAGRDHHPSAFTMWMGGGGVKGGFSYGETDEIGFLPVVNPVQVQDLHRTKLHLLGLDHERLTYPWAGGLNQRLTTVTKEASLLSDILA